MDTFDNSSHSSLLHAFIDGDIDPYDEQTLFVALATNSELRMELRDCMQIGSLARADASRMLPPGALYERIAGSLGITATHRVDAATTPQPASQRSFPIPALLVSAVLGALVMLLFLRTSPESVQSIPTMPAIAATETLRRVAGHGYAAGQGHAAMPAHGNTPQSGTLASIGGISRGIGQPSVTSAPGAHRTHAARPDNTAPAGSRARDRRVAVGASEHPDATVAITEPAAVTSTMLRSADPATVAVPHALDRFRHVAVHSPISVVDDDSRISATIRGFHGVAFPDNGLVVSTPRVFSNVAIGVDYRLREHEELGVEFGQEQFPQRYSGVENGRAVEYRQTPLLAWGAVRYRNEALRFGNALGAYWSVGLGGTIVGPLLRSEIGLEYGTGNGVSLVAGLDATLLAYRFDAGWHTTRRLAACYGARVRF